MCMGTLHGHKAQNATIVTFTILIFKIINKLNCIHIHIMSKPITLHPIFHPNQDSNVTRKNQKNFTGFDLCFFRLDIYI